MDDNLYITLDELEYFFNSDGFGEQEVVKQQNEDEHQDSETEAPAAPLPPVSGLEVGKKFTDIRTCRKEMKDIAIQNRFEMLTLKSDRVRFTAECAAEGCPWRIHIAKDQGSLTVSIRKLHNVHSCSGFIRIGGHQQATVEWIAKAAKLLLKYNPDSNPKTIVEEIHQRYGIILTYPQAWRGKERFLAYLHKEFKEEFRLLPEFCYHIKKSNPGSIANVHGDPDDGKFQRLFISLNASIQGFLNTCRPLLGLDRIPLKSRHQGSLLFATSFDADGGAFPLAFAIVDEETDENWKWFVYELYDLVSMNAEYSPYLTFLSNFTPGIVDGVQEYFPSAFHGLCMRHFSNRFQENFDDIYLTKLLWEAANALTEIDFECLMLRIKKLSKEAFDWINEVVPSKWATSWFGGTRFGQLTCSVESFNAVMLQASTLPPIQLMEAILAHLSSLFSMRLEASWEWTSALVPSAEKQIAGFKQASQHHLNVTQVTDVEFEVISINEGVFMVDISSCTCSCKGWQLLVLPCVHAVAAVGASGQIVEEFVGRWFTTETFRRTYAEAINPVPKKDLWKEMRPVDEELLVIAPPKALPPPETPKHYRPKKKTVSSEDNRSGKRVMRCSRCNKAGHHRTTCKVPV